MKKINDFFNTHKKQAIAIISVLIILIGTSFAWFTITLNGTKNNTIATANLSLKLSENSKAGISITDAEPVSDNIGLKYEPYEFSVTNDGNVSSYYSIYLDDLELPTGEVRIADKYVKYSLERDGQVLATKLLSTTGTNPNRILDKDSIPAGETYTYTLKIWIDENATNEAQNTSFLTQVRVEGTQDNLSTNTYAVHFDYQTNGGVSSNAENLEDVSVGDEIDLTSLTATKVGYTFVGWNTNKTSTTGLTTYKMTNNRVKLYAIFKKDLSSNLYYYENNKVEKSTLTCTVYNSNNECDYNIPDNVKNGIGPDDSIYFGLSSKTSTSTKEDTINSSNENYYAIYNGKWTAKYTAGTGVIGIGATNDSCDNVKTTDGINYSSTSCDITLSTITLDNGYSNSYWAKDNVKVGSPKDKYTLSENVDLVATGDLNTYTVTYDYKTNGGSSASKETDTVGYNKDIDLTVTAIKTGYEFIGWSTDKDATSGTTGIKMPTDNVTLYAIYRKTVDASFYYYDGEKQEKATNSCTIFNNDSNSICSYSLPSELLNSTGPNNSSYVGVSKDINSNTLTTIYNVSIGINYYAVYSGTVTVNYQKGTGTSTIGKSTDSCVAYKTTNGTNYINGTCDITLPSITPLTGYTADGWYNGDTKVGNASSTYKLSENLLLSGKSKDSTAPVCTVKVTDDVEVGKTVDAEVNCTDNDGVKTTTLTKDNFSISNSNAEIEDVSTGIKIDNGYKYSLSIKGLSTGTYTLSLNANSVLDNTDNGNIKTTSNDNTVVGHTYTASFIKQGTGVTAIGATSLSCTTTGSNDTCTVTAPSITVSTGYTGIGWDEVNTSHSGTAVGGTITLDNNKMFYSISSKNEVTYIATFNKNGAAAQDSSTNDIVTKKCTIGKVYNSEVQDTTCTVVTPTITGSTNTPTVVGYNESSSATTSQINQNTSLTLSGNKTYYAITKNSSIERKITYTKQGFGVTAIGTTSDSCTIKETYNGTAQATSCTVKAPTITVNTGYTVVGWNETNSATSGTAVGDLITLTKDTTYYSISYKNEIEYKAKWNANNSTLSSTADSSCTIGKAYNNNEQAISCTVTAPTITASSNTPIVVGYNDTISAITNNSSYNATSKLLTLNSTNTGKTWYAITRKDAISYTATFNANGNTIASTSQKCTIGETYNGAKQATTCDITTPVITAPTNTPTVVGYVDTKDSTSKVVGSNEKLALSGNRTLYALTKKDEVNYSVNYALGTNTSAIGSTIGSCTINPTYNGTAQATSCDVKTPSITSNEGYEPNGWSQTINTSGIGVNETLTINSTNDKTTYYGNSKSSTYTIAYISEGTNLGTSSANFDKEINLTTASTLNISKTGYTFKGWDTNSSATNVVYTDGKAVTNLVSTGGTTVNLYAVWQDEIGPSCTWSSAASTTTGNNTTLTLSCTDTGSKMTSQTLSTTNFTTSNSNGSIVSVGAPTAITNGYSYVITVKGNSVGTFTTSLNAKSISDNYGNSNTVSTSGNVTVNGRTYTATFTKQGTGVTAIGATSLSCTTTGSNLSCNVTAPSITVSTGYTAVGWDEINTSHSGTAVGGTITLDSNKTFYSISSKNEVTYTATFNKNGALNQTNSSNTAVTDTTVTRSCTIGKVYNGEVQGTSCTVITPTITGSTNTPTVVGYNESSTGTISQINQNTSLTLSGSKMYYAITKKDAISRTATFVPNGNYVSIGVGDDMDWESTSNDVESCIISATYNGTAQATSCSVTSPKIKGNVSPTPIVIGFNENSNGTTSTWNINTSKSISSNVTYYAITTNSTINYSVSYSKGSNVSSIGSTTGSCSIAPTYNGVAQATTCTVTLPSIMPNSGYTSAGWSLISGDISGINAVSSLTLDSTNNGKTYYANANSIGYTIAYYSDGTNKGTSGAKYGSNVTLTNASTLNITKAGYTFKGWDTSSAASTVVYTNGQTVSNLTTTANETVNLYAVWADETGPSCTWSSLASITYGSTGTMTLSCTDTGSKMASQTLATSSFTSSGTTYGTITNVSSPTAITNGYSYTVTVSGVNAGSFNVSLNAGVLKDNTNNTNAKTTSSNITVAKSPTATTGSCASLTYNGAAQTLASGATYASYTSNFGTNAGSYSVTVASDTNHTFSDGTTSKTLSCSIAKRATTCTAASSSRVYNGSALSDTTGGSCTNLVSGHAATLTNTGSITNVGSTTNTLSAAVIKSGTTDVSANYSITKVNGTLTVTRLNTATTGSCASLTYNGSAQTLAASGSYVSYKDNSGTNAGSYNIIATADENHTFSDGATSKTLSCSIAKATPTLTLSASSGSVNKGSNVSYTETASIAGNFSNTSGTTTVATVSPASYTGVALNTAKTVTVTGVSNGTSTITSSFTPTDTTNYNSVSKTYTVTGYLVSSTGSCASLTYNGAAQTLASGGTGVSYTNNSGTDASSYTVTVTASSGYRFSDNSTSKTLSCSIAKKAVTYTAGTTSKTYDGTALTSSTVTLTSGALVSGHAITTTTSGTITDVGSTTNTLSSVVIKSGTMDVSTNYSITKVNGTLTVNKRATTCTAGSTSKTYDGSALSNTTTGSCTNIVSGQTTTFTNTGSITNAGSTTNTLSSIVIKNGTTDVSANYTITKANGTLTVNKRAVTYTAGSTSRAYNGSALTNTTVTLTSGSLVSGHTATTTTSGTITNVGSVTNTLSSVVINSGTTDVSANYTITKANGTLTITRLNTASAAAANKTYTAAAQTGVTGSYVTWTGTTSATNAGSYTAYATPDSNHSWSDGTYAQKTITWTMSKRATTCTASSSSRAYNGSALTLTSGGSCTNLVSGHAATLTNSGTITNVGSVTNTLSTVVIKSGTTDVSANYTITKVNGTLTVTRLNTATTGSCASLTYNGAAQTLAIGGSYVSYSNNSKTTAGSQTVTITADGNHSFSDGATSKTLSCSIAKATYYPTVDGSTTLNQSGSIDVGASIDIFARASSSNDGVINFSGYDSSIINIKYTPLYLIEGNSNNVEITGLKVGTTKITMTYVPNDTTNYNNVVYTYTVTVNPLTFTAYFNANGNTVASTSKSCTTSGTATTCTVTTPVITAPSNTPYVAGYKYESSAGTTSVDVGSNATLTLSSSNSGATYYAQTYKTAVTRTATFNANGNTISKTSASCTIGVTYNGTAQATACSVTSPTITAPSNTPSIYGFSTAAATHSNGWSVNTPKAISSNVTYYAQTYKASVTRTASYAKGSNVSAIGSTSNSCTIGATYNGTAQGTTCSVTLPSITANSGYISVGWSTTNGVASGTGAGSSYTLSGNVTLYANAITAVYNYSYTGGIQSFKAPISGTYKLEVWGAQGGSSVGSDRSTVANGQGGYGGHSYGNKYLSANTTIYIQVGGKGTNGISGANYAIPGGYNGGGNGSPDYSDDESGGGGGGATSITTTNRGVLSAYSSYRSEVLIVAGGGGGACWTTSGGAGGGSQGGCGGYISCAYSTSSTSSSTSYCNQGYINGAGQSYGYSFGQGQSASQLHQGASAYPGGGDSNANGLGGGGGGYYGGWSITYKTYDPIAPAGSGGSGYIGSLTGSVLNEAGKNSGNGYAKITLIS